MKTILALCRRFNRIHADSNSTAELDELGSYPGHYRICISTNYPGAGTLNAWYVFSSCRDFKEWTDGVIFE